MKKLGLLSLTFVVGLGAAVWSAHGSGPPFSNGTLSGTYVFSLYVGINGGDVIGTATFDGNGNVSGTLHQNLVVTSPISPPSVASCDSTISSGTYAVDSTGSFTMTVTVTPGDDCAGSTVHSFTGAVDHSGKSFVFVTNPLGPGNGPGAGSGIIQ